MNSARRLKELGRAAGFDLVRIGPATDMHVERARYLQWVADGRHADMRWITDERAMRSTSPQTTLPDARSVISVGMSYWGGHRPNVSGSEGRIARYAWGRDYHEVMGDRLRELSVALREEFGGEHRWYVDTGPAMDRAFAAQSGLGWSGKNTNVITEAFGSYVVLGEVITTLEAEPDPRLTKSCGSCRLCMVACPTGALGPEYSLDSRKCISYLTIEHRGPISRELRPLIGSWVFGCDICQDVCPPAMEPFLHGSAERRQWAAEVRGYISGDRAATSTPPSENPTPNNPLFPDYVRSMVDLVWLLRLQHDEYVEAFRGSAIKRAKVWMLRRNAAVALGNVGDIESTGPVIEALQGDEHAVVRGHAAWALGRLGQRLGSEAAMRALRTALDTEYDQTVLEEVTAALSSLRDSSPMPG